MRVIGSTGPAPPPPPPLRLRLARRLQRSRRVVVALLLAVASGSAVHAVAAARSSPPSVRVVVAARDLPIGRSLTRSDTAAVALPVAVVPAGAFQARSRTTGHVLTGAVRRGEVLTDARVSGRGLLVASGGGQLAVPVRIDTPLPAGLLAAGDAVAVLAGSDGDSGSRDSGSGVSGSVSSDAGTSDPVSALDERGDPPTAAASGGEVLVRRARVLALPPEPASSGLLASGGSTASGGGAVVVLALDPAQATEVAGVAGQRPLTLALLGG